MDTEIRIILNEGEASQETYQYEQLDHSLSVFRIFTLLPAPNKAAPLVGHLCNTSFPPKQSGYDALSYVWGEPTKEHVLWIGNKKLMISWNLHQALIHIRHPSDSRDLWIDAICINQENTGEKTHQVREMHSIYSTASKVIIWLGEADEDSDYAISRINTMSLNDNSNAPHVLDAPDVDLRRISKIFERPWWTRIWTVQEGILAGQDSVVLCGNKQTKWGMLLKTIDFIVSPRIVDVCQMGALIHFELGGFSSLHRLRQEGQKQTLVDLLYISAHRKASDDRDQVYALTGLITKPGANRPDPDYSQPTSWVYQRAMISIFQDEKNLNCLINLVHQRYSRNEAMSKELSWCANFAKRKGIFALHDHVTQSGATTGRENFRIENDLQRGTITISGTIIGTIVSSDRSIGDWRPGIDQPLAKGLRVVPQDVDDLERNMPHRMRVLLDKMVTFTKTFEDVWRRRLGQEQARSKVKIGDVWKIAAHGWQVEDFIRGTGYVPGIFAIMATLAEHGSHQLHQKINIVPPPHFDVAIAAYKLLSSEGFEKTLFFTTDTNYVGATRECVHVGDCLCILFGCNRPVVLRPRTDGTYELIDHAYTDGVMDGEFLRDGSSYVEMDFVLR